MASEYKAGRFTEESFQGEVEHIMAERGFSFVRAVYNILEMRLGTQGQDLVCTKGCSACCYQLVTCTGLEFDEISRFIQSRSGLQRKAILRGAGKAVRAWQKYYAKHEQIIAFMPRPLCLVEYMRFGLANPVLFSLKAGAFAEFILSVLLIAEP